MATPRIPDFAEGAAYLDDFEDLAAFVRQLLILPGGDVVPTVTPSGTYLRLVGTAGLVVRDFLAPNGIPARSGIHAGNAACQGLTDGITVEREPKFDGTVWNRWPVAVPKDAQLEALLRGGRWVVVDWTCDGGSESIPPPSVPSPPPAPPPSPPPPQPPRNDPTGPTVPGDIDVPITYPPPIPWPPNPYPTRGGDGGNPVVIDPRGYSTSPSPSPSPGGPIPLAPPGP